MHFIRKASVIIKMSSEIQLLYWTKCNINMSKAHSRLLQWLAFIIIAYQCSVLYTQLKENDSKTMPRGQSFRYNTIR